MSEIEVDSQDNGVIIKEKSKMANFFSTVFGDWRLGRINMFIAITAAVTYGLGGTWQNIVYAGAIGATLSAGGFFLDYFMDHKEDRESGKLSNPIAKGTLSPVAGLILIILLLATAVTLTIVSNVWAVIPAVCVILVILGLGYGLLNTPILRAISLGVLQGLYVLIGAILADNLTYGSVLIALFLFFAMTGGRALGDTRDLPYDLKTDKETIPRKYGLRFTSIFLLICELIAYGFAISIYFTGITGIAFLYCMIATAVIGFASILWFVIKPTPKVGNIVNILSLFFLGTLFILGLILGELL